MRCHGGVKAWARLKVAHQVVEHKRERPPARKRVEKVVHRENGHFLVDRDPYPCLPPETVDYRYPLRPGQLSGDDGGGHQHSSKHVTTTVIPPAQPEWRPPPQYTPPYVPPYSYEPQHRRYIPPSIRVRSVTVCSTGGCCDGCGCRECAICHEPPASVLKELYGSRHATQEDLLGRDGNAEAPDAQMEANDFLRWTRGSKGKNQ